MAEDNDAQADDQPEGAAAKPESKKADDVAPKKKRKKRAEASSPQPKPRPKPPSPPIFHRWMAFAIVFGLLAASASAYSYHQYSQEWLRRQPKLKICSLGLRNRLGKGEVATGDQEALGVNDEKVYLTANELRASQCGAEFSSDASKGLASAFAEREDDARADKLAALITTIPKMAIDRDVEAANLFQLVRGSLEGIPKSAHRDKRIEEVEETHACRFLRPRACVARPKPTLTWTLGFVAGAPVALVIASLAQSLIQRWRSRRGHSSMA